jgi:hypothetical protein
MTEMTEIKDYFLALTKAETDGDIESIKELKKRITVSRLNFIRAKIEENNFSALESADNIINFLKNLNNEEISDDDFLKIAANIIADEYKYQKENPGLYIIDTDTGRAIIKADESSFYRPQDWTDENGNIHHPGLIIHPGISSSLGLKKYEDEKRNNQKELALDKISKNPALKSTFEHMLNPVSIIDYTKSVLLEMGVKIEKLTDNAIDDVIEVGKEHIDGEYQSMNMNFHRAHMYGALVAKKLMLKYDDIISCDVIEVTENSNTKHKWFSVKVKVRSPKLLRNSTNVI